MTDAGSPLSGPLCPSPLVSSFPSRGPGRVGPAGFPAETDVPAVGHTRTGGDSTRGGTPPISLFAMLPYALHLPSQLSALCCTRISLPSCTPFPVQVGNRYRKIIAESGG